MGMNASHPTPHTLSLTQPDDWHVHLRDGAALQAIPAVSFTQPGGALGFAATDGGGGGGGGGSGDGARRGMARRGSGLYASLTASQRASIAAAKEKARAAIVKRNLLVFRSLSGGND